jgi:hypothetical protein
LIGGIIYFRDIKGLPVQECWHNMKLWWLRNETVMCQLASGHYFLNTDISPHKIWFTSDGLAEALVQLQQRYRFDGILINQPGRPDSILDRAVSIEDVADGEMITWDSGETTLTPWKMK